MYYKFNFVDIPYNWLNIQYVFQLSATVITNNNVLFRNITPTWFSPVIYSRTSNQLEQILYSIYQLQMTNIFRKSSSTDDLPSEFGICS